MRRYDGFISYSHAGDGRLAPRLQAGVQKFACPWWRPRALRIFRDQTGLSANPNLWDSIVEAIDDSSWFLLLASPQAATSEWIGKEISHWVEHGDPDHLLVVVTDGTFVWDEAAGDIDWANSTAAHPALRGVFRSEPRYIDVAWAKSEVNLDRRDGRFQDACAEIAAPLRGVAKDELAGEDVRQHRRTIRLAQAAGAALALLTVIAVVAGVLAVGQRNEARDRKAEAEAQRAEAEAQRTEADAQRIRADAQALTATARGAASGAIAETDVAIDRALLLAAAGVQLQETPETMAGLLTALDVASGLRSFHHDVTDVSALDLSPDGSQLAMVTQTGRLSLRDRATFSLEREATIDARNPYGLEFLADGQTLVMHAEDGVWLIDVETLTAMGEPIIPTRLSTGGSVVGDVADDGSSVVVSEFGSDSAELFSLPDRTPGPTFALDDRCAYVRGLDVSTATGRLAVACINWTEVFDLNSGASVAGRESYDANGPLFSPDGRILAVGYTVNVVVLINMETFTVFEQIRTPGTRVYSMDFSASGQLLAVGTDSGDVQVYQMVPDYTTIDPVTQQPTAWTAATETLGFSGIEGGVSAAVFDPAQPDTGEFAPAIVVAGPVSVSEWAQASGPAIASEHLTDVGGLVDPAAREVYRAVNPSPNDGAADEFEVVGLDGEVRRRLTFDEPTTLLAIDASSSTLAVIGAGEWPASDGSELVGPSHLEIDLVDPATGAVRASFDLAAAAPIPVPQGAYEQFGVFPEGNPGGRYVPHVTVEFSPDGRRLLAAPDGGEAGVWDVGTAALVAHGRPAMWGPDANTLLRPGNGELEVIRVDGWASVGKVSISPGFSISDVVAMPGTSEVLVTSEQGTITVVDVTTLRTVGAPFRANGIQLQQTAVDAERTLVTAIDRNGALRVWSFDDRAPLGPPFRALGMSTSLFAEVAFHDGGAVVYQVPLEAVFIPLSSAALVETACRLAGRQLSADEWATHVGDLPQVPCS